jgi:hypothetical protein
MGRSESCQRATEHRQHAPKRPRRAAAGLQAWEGDSRFGIHGFAVLSFLADGGVNSRFCQPFAAGS